MNMKMETIEQGIYKDVKCQWRASHMAECPDFEPKTENVNK